MSDIEHLKIILDKYTCLNNYSYKTAINKFHKLSEIILTLDYGIIFTFIIDNGKINTERLNIKANKNVPEIIKFIDTLENTQFRNACSVLNIFDHKDINIEFKFDSHKEHRKREIDITAIITNDKYKMLIDNNQFSNNLSIFSTKDNNILAEEYLLGYVSTFEDFFYNIEFKLNQNVMQFLENKSFKDFNEIMDYYFNDVKELQKLSTLINY